MKKLLLLLCLLVGVVSQAQTINDIPLSEIDTEYVQIVGTSKLFSNKLTISMDFGQHTKFMGGSDIFIKDENKKIIVFNSMVDALNFMYNNGYVFEAAYVITLTNTNVYHYLLKKKNKEE